MCVFQCLFRSQCLSALMPSTNTHLLWSVTGRIMGWREFSRHTVLFLLLHWPQRRWTRWSSCRSSGFGPVSSGSSCVSRSASRRVNPAARLSSCAPCVIKRFPCSACWRVTWSATVCSRDTPAGTAGRASTTPSTWRDTWEHTPVRSRHSHSHQNNLSTHKIFTCHSFWKLTLKQQKHTPNLQPDTNSAFDSVLNFIKHNTTHSSLCNTHKSNRN